MDTEDGLNRIWETYFRASRICLYEAHMARAQAWLAGLPAKAVRRHLGWRIHAPSLAHLGPCLSIQSGAYITTKLLVTYSPPAEHQICRPHSEKSIIIVRKARP